MVCGVPEPWLAVPTTTLSKTPASLEVVLMDPTLSPVLGVAGWMGVPGVDAPE